MTRGAAARPTLCGRADLLRVLDVDPALADGLARRLGFHKAAPAAPEKTERDPAPPGDVEVAPLVAPEPATPAPLETLRFHRVVHIEARGPELPPSAEQAAPALPWSPQLAPPFQPLCPWPRLWPRLEPVLGHMQATRELDVPRMVERISRGQWVGRLPHRVHRRMPARVVLIVDRARALTAYWEDQELVYRGLCRRLGPQRVDWLAVREGPPAVLAPSQREAVVLALSDLGALSAPNVQNRWRDFAAQLASRGQRAAALVPLSLARLRADTRRAFGVRAWEPGPLARPGARPEADAIAATARRLLALSAPAIRIEPGLLRAIRRSALPLADAGVEGDVCAHAAVAVCTSTALVLYPKESAQLRAEFALATPTERAAAVAAIFAAHQSLRPEILSEELAGLSALMPSAELPWLSTWARQHLRWEAQQQLLLPASETEARPAWYRRLAPRIPGGLWSDGELGDALRPAYLRAHAELPDALPDGLHFRVRDYAAAGLAVQRPERYSVYQVGTELEVRREGERPGSAHAPRGVHLADVQAGVPQLDLVRVPENEHALALGLREGRARCELPVDAQYVLETDRTRLVVEAAERPYWADAIHHDGTGLEATVQLDDTVAHFRWTLPEVGDAAWLPEPGSTPSWATRLGCDGYGVYAEFALGGVTQQMRWLPPGRFWMGSPEDEVGRSDDETLHEVVLTRGYWLADTACTQALWEVVMGVNPSEFKGAGLPVENVSWEDCQTFMERSEALSPGLGLQLPTEAEWEYACRAGSRTAFSFGATVTVGQVNYSVEGERRNQTVDVKALPCNAWGLYQMHGNVWEWCSDWYGPYDLKAVADPSGPEVGSLRVLRGGSWFFPAQFARAAQRFGRLPGFRYVLLGLRVSRGRTGTGTASLPEAGGRRLTPGAEPPGGRRGTRRAFRWPWSKKGQE